MTVGVSIKPIMETRSSAMFFNLPLLIFVI